MEWDRREAWGFGGCKFNPTLYKNNEKKKKARISSDQKIMSYRISHFTSLYVTVQH